MIISSKGVTRCTEKSRDNKVETIATEQMNKKEGLSETDIAQVSMIVKREVRTLQEEIRQTLVMGRKF